MLIVPVSEGEDTQNTVLGAPVGCGVGQNLDNFLTNVQVLSSFCPMFVQVLSMSNICQKNFNFTKFCQIIVQNFVKESWYSISRLLGQLQLGPNFPQLKIFGYNSRKWLYQQ